MVDMQTDGQAPTNGHVLVPMQNRGEKAVRRAVNGRDPETPRPRLTASVVIPTLNEAGNIGPVLHQLEAFDDIVLVDGFSDDGTVEIARSLRPDLTILERPPHGKGDALRAGFAAATGDV